MLFPARTRKALLTVHVSCSVGWLGAVLVFLVLAVLGLMRTDPVQVRAVYVSLDLIVWYVIVPLCLAALITGVVQSLGTTWGLLRHYWLLIKLLLTVSATVALLVHTRPVGFLAGEAAGMDLAGGDLGQARVQLIAAAAAAVLVLLAATVLSIYKPRGLTRYGLRRLERQQRQDRSPATPTGAPAP
jgi:hypothetical protein